MRPEPDDSNRPRVPARMDQRNEEPLLPQAPPRMDIAEGDTSHSAHKVIPNTVYIKDRLLVRRTFSFVIATAMKDFSHQTMKTIDEDLPKDCACNYNLYATKKTVGHGLLEFALLTSNAMQLRTLTLQKQRDAIWIASLVLVCISILAQLALAYILVVVGKGNIQNPQKQERLEKYNNLSLFLTVLISAINVIINGFMTSTNSMSYVDLPLLQSSANHT